MAKIVRVYTKYKTVDKKVKPVAIPLVEDSWQKMKEVARDPSLRIREESDIPSLKRQERIFV